MTRHRTRKTCSGLLSIAGQGCALRGGYAPLTRWQSVLSARAAETRSLSYGGLLLAALYRRMPRKRVALRHGQFRYHRHVPQFRPQLWRSKYQETNST